MDLVKREAVLVGNIVDDPDFPYRVVCDDCGVVVGHARIVDQVGGVYHYQWRHEDPDHECVRRPMSDTPSRVP